MATWDQVWTYFESLVTLWRKSGGKLAPLEVVKERYDQCARCPHFTGRNCSLCGCCTNHKKSLFNKLAYPLEECPDGRWFKYEPEIKQKPHSSIDEWGFSFNNQSDKLRKTELIRSLRKFVDE